MTFEPSVRFLTDLQLAHGSFRSSSSSQLSPHRTDASTVTIFQNALILDCLCSLPPSSEGTAAQRRIADFLLVHKSPEWSFNYWPRASPEAQQYPYPDDLDDTACALAALFRYDRTLIDGTALANVVTLLTASEVAEGGPYYTWIVPPASRPEWSDVDLAINSNVAYFLSLHEVTLPNIVTFTEEAINQAAYSSPYYPSVYPLIYFISRWYRGARMYELRKTLWDREENGRWENELYTALAVSSLLRLHCPWRDVRHSVQYLEEAAVLGAWPALSFCADPAREGVAFYAGSAALTTAFCLEALALYAAAKGTAASIRSVRTETVPATLYATAETAVHHRWRQVGTEMPVSAQRFLARILAYDKEHSLSVTPYYFLRAMGVTASTVNMDLLSRTTLLSMYGWLAYTIYDYFRDGEGEAALLSLATVALRELTTLLPEVVPDQPGFLIEAQMILDQIEAANVWEVIHCRSFEPLSLPDFGDYAVLAQRSLGHSLATNAVLRSCGYEDDLPAVRRFFHHFLIARQLNDDLHDWEEDLAHQHINVVAAWLLRHHAEGATTLEKLPELSVLREFFWLQAVTNFCDRIDYELALAEKSFLEMTHLKNPRPLQRLLKSLSEVARHTRSQRQKTLDFLHAYQAGG